jgi:hypothetical protein
MHVGAEEKPSWANVMAYLPIVRVQPLSLLAIPAMDGSCPCCGISWVGKGSLDSAHTCTLLYNPFVRV